MAARRDAASGSAKKASGRSIGQFNIDKEIGKGSFAQVYMGWHKETKAAVAIKSVDLERLNKKLKENLYGEIQILKTLRHPHIVALHDCLESTTHINLIMEYCELGDLSLFIKKRDKLITHPATHDMARKYPSAPNSGLHEVVIRHFLKQLTSALEFLRSKNYIHRDVKPQNLLLLPCRAFRRKDSLPIMEASQDSLIPAAGLLSLPMLKLADFGFARVLPQTSLAETLCGSPLYMAPEILRYEKYDAKADLWSVGTVIYEMATGRPPFRARNHVELLRKIEAAEDVIKFPREVTISSDLKALIRRLLKRNPVERLSFESLFNNIVVTGDIPGLVEDDVPKPAKRDLESIPQGTKLTTSSARPAPTRAVTGDPSRTVPESQHLRDGRQSSPRTTQPMEIRSQRPTMERAGEETGDAHEGLGIRRPAGPHHTASMPNQTRSGERHGNRGTLGQDGTAPELVRRPRATSNRSLKEAEAAAQDVAFERDYVVVERRHVEVNALADELAANDTLGTTDPMSPRSGQSRRYTQQGTPNSTSGAVPTPSSQTALIAQGRAGHDRRSSYDKPLSVSPGSASSAISKAIQDASLRLFGFKVNPLRTPSGQSPPMYHAFPAYPAPPSAGLLGDGRIVQSGDEDVRAAHTIEELATRSDCVYGFAEVKYRQLIPMAPSAEQGLGGIDLEQAAAEEDGLTVEAILAVSEEALVLYVKSLTLLARAMDIASVWWSKKSRAEGNSSGVTAAVSQTIAQRINAVVQWVRQRFNEVLEKSEIVRLKLMEAQKQLPEDHPSHPANRDTESVSFSGASGPQQVFLTPGIGAEKLMYDRALEMSRAAAIDEVTNENLPGCELSYVTAIRMLEAVLDNDEEHTGRKLLSSKDTAKEEAVAAGRELDSDEEAHIRKMITMISGRLNSVRKKMHIIADASGRSPQSQQPSVRRRSGDVTPRSVRSHTSG